jgi:alpha/beta superfamily hydrolase
MNVVSSPARAPPTPRRTISEPMRRQDTQPLYFGNERRPLFGWLHPGTATSVGLVICSPFGDEAVRAHRSTYHLAAAASDAGIPALRFDYDGTGDSAGHDLEPNRVGQWLASIHSAADFLRAQTGVTQVCFLGIRLGATLATLAAGERNDVAGLIALAPVVSGKAYVRELRLLQRAIDSKRGIVAGDSDGTLETAGFLLAESTQNSLAGIDLLRTGKRPAPRVLVLERAEMPTAEKWAQKLREWDTLVDYSPMSGYAEMMLDNHESIVPQGIVAAATHWLRHLPTHPHTDTPAGAGTALDSVTLIAPAVADPMLTEPRQTPVQEHAVRFGDCNRLFGIVTTPKDKSEVVSGGEAVLLLNAGAVPHIGPSRMYVTFARHLAQLGYTVLRMDIASIGDSPPHPGQPEIDVYSPYALQDIAAAIEYLRSHWHARAVISTGICSGAYHSLKAAVAQYPLAQVILINPLTFFWKPGMSLRYPEYRVAQDIQRYRKTALTLASWKKLVTGRVDLLNLVGVLTRSASARLGGPIRALARLAGRPLADDLPTELRTVLKGSIDLQFVFSAQDPGLELLRTQGGARVRSMQERGQISVSLVEGANHTFTDLLKRRILLQLLVEKVRARRGPVGARRAS